MLVIIVWQMQKILLIEDSRDIAVALSQALATSYSVTVATKGHLGLTRAQNDGYDLIILDLSLPDMPGLEVCQKLRQHAARMPILVLTGESGVMSKIRLLDAGADDYLTKPFSLGELKARLRVLERRDQPARANQTRLSVGDLILDKDKHRVERAGTIIKLRRKEFALLECLMEHAGTVVTRSMLGNHAWQGSDKPWTNTIDVHIKHLRDKVDRPFARPMVRTVHGLGYKLETDAPITKEER